MGGVDIFGQEGGFGGGGTDCEVQFGTGGGGGGYTGGHGGDYGGGGGSFSKIDVLEWVYASWPESPDMDKIKTLDAGELYTHPSGYLWWTVSIYFR